MNIKPDFSQKFIVSAQGETQIKLVLLIYDNIFKNYNFTTVISKCETAIKITMKSLKDGNIKPELLFTNAGLSNNLINLNAGTVFTRRKLEKYYALNRTESIKGDYFLENIHEKYNLKEYKLIYMKEFLKVYGKYLFINEESRNSFVGNYPELEISPVMQIIKQIPF